MYLRSKSCAPKCAFNYACWWQMIALVISGDIAGRWSPLRISGNDVQIMTFVHSCWWLWPIIPFCPFQAMMNQQRKKQPGSFRHLGVIVVAPEIVCRESFGQSRQEIWDVVQTFLDSGIHLFSNCRHFGHMFRSACKCLLPLASIDYWLNVYLGGQITPRWST